MKFRDRQTGATMEFSDAVLDLYGLGSAEHEKIAVVHAQIADARRVCGQLFDDNQQELLKVLEAQPGIPFTSAVKQALASRKVVGDRFVKIVDASSSGKSNAYKFLVTFAMSLYGAFVLQSLWNWFAVPALNVPPISYWLMYGLNMLAQTVRSGPDTFPMLVRHAQLPDAEKRRVEETLTDEKLWDEVLLPMTFTKVFSLTATLATGWAIHVLLS